MLSNSVSGLPVIDGQGKIVGVISESDIIRRREGLLAHWLEVETFLGRNQAESDDDIEDPEYLNCVVEDAMTRNPVSVGPDTPVREAARLMVAHKINRLPVVDKAQIVGIVTRGDIMRAFTTRTS